MESTRDVCPKSKGECFNGFVKVERRSLNSPSRCRGPICYFSIFSCAVRASSENRPSYPHIWRSSADRCGDCRRSSRRSHSYSVGAFLAGATLQCPCQGHASGERE